MRIAYVGPDWGTSRHRASALRRLGHSVTVIDPWGWLGPSPWISRWLHHTGGLGVGLLVDARLVKAVTAVQPDLVWVDQGPFIGPNVIRRFKRGGVPVVNYTIDDPFGGRDGRRFRAYFKALAEYDLLAVVREPNVKEAQRHGARSVMRVWMSADEVAHRLRVVSPEQVNRYRSEVAFVGTWLPERGPFLARLIALGVPLAIWGDRWHKAPEWPCLAPHWRGPSLNDDASYAAAIRAARVCLGLLSKGNRDLHTTRSLEIPSLGGLLCAERTTEHLELYEEGVEAVFWDDADDCAALCHSLLADEPRRVRIAAIGRRRAVANNLFNEPIMQCIIDAVRHARPVGMANDEPAGGFKG